MAFETYGIATTLGLNMNPFAQGMIQATGIARVFPQTVQNFMASPLLGLIGIAQQVTRAITSMFTQITDSLDDIGDAAQGLGVSVNFLWSLGRAAKMAGSDLGSVQEALKFLGKNAADAAAGQKVQIAAFDKLGISAEFVRENLGDMEAMVMAVSDGMARFGSQGEKNAAAMDLFGRGGAAMTRILGEGSAAVRRQIQDVNVLGKVFTDKAAKNAGVWNDMVDVLSGAWDQFKVLLMEPIRDALMPYLKSVLDWARAHPAEIRAYAERAAKAIVEAIEDLIDIGKILGRVLETIAHHLGPIMFGMAAIFAIKAIAGLVAAYNSLRLAIAATAAAQAGFSAAGLAAMAGKAGIAGLAGAGVGYGVGKLFGTSENQTSGMMWGGAGGAAAGAAIGALFGAGIGAIPGAIIGGLLGLLGGLTVGTDQDRAATEDATQSHVQYGIELLKVNDALAETQRMSADAAAGLGQVAAALAEVRDSVQFPKVTDYTQSQTRSSGGSGSGSGITIQRMELNVAPIDYNEASSAIAGKLQPKLRQAIEQQNRQLEAAAGLAAVKAGL